MNIGKFLGSVLLVVGISIGGGMLALPIATAEGGMVYAALCFILCWLLMYSGAILILEILQPLPLGSNMVSLSKYYLGTPGIYLAWLLNLGLLYALMAAYIAGGTDILQSILNLWHIKLSNTTIAILYATGFAVIIYSGIRSVDYVNRGLMFTKLGAYLLLIIIVGPFIRLQHFIPGHLQKIFPQFSILITSFGFAAIVPSLRDYWHNDIKQLKRIIFWGSIIPLICYLIWNFVIMGTIPSSSPYHLTHLLHSSRAISELGIGLGITTHSPIILNLFDCFSGICMLTAFLNVSLGLFDFLADGLHLKKIGVQAYLILATTFIPPLILVIFHPGIYLSALKYAGLFCIALQLLLPIIMSWKARRQHQISPLIPGNTWVLSGLLSSTIFCIILPYLTP